MALTKLDDQIRIVNKAILRLLDEPNHENAVKTADEYHKLRKIITRFATFTEHSWDVVLYTKDSSASIKIEADHLPEALETVAQLVDVFSEVTRYELYCDGLLLPETLTYVKK